jgi:hypothetical protein
MQVEVREQTVIGRPAWEVRDQFRDLTYHAEHAVHPRVRSAVIERRNGQCRYVRVDEVGPIDVHHEVVLANGDDATLVHHVVAGPLRGAVLRVVFTWVAPDETHVDAQLLVQLRGARRLFAPTLRRLVRRRLAAALDADRRDLEAGRYTRDGGRPRHPSLGGAR